MQTTARLPSHQPRIAQIAGSRLFMGTSALGVIVAIAAWQWSWLVAVGAAPLLLSVAPCVAMCGLGLCMHRLDGRACATAPSDGRLARDDSSATKET